MTSDTATRTDSSQVRPLRSPSLRLLRVLPRHLVALALALIFFAPFLWAALSSLKAANEIFVFPPKWFPEVPQWNNYVAVWTQVPFARFLLNTVIITVVSLIGQVATATLVAYGFARFKFPGHDALFMLVLATLILPEEVTLIPRFILFRTLHWLDTFLPLTVPSYFGGGAFSIFLLRQFILTLPVELDEAAELDGAGNFRVLWNVLVPLMKPALATVAIFSFLGNWNSFIDPLIYLRSTEKFTLQLGLRFFQQAAETGGAPREPFMMAASLMVAAPCIALFFVAQRYFVRGIVMSGLKY
jgi:multiple sugar transport system permease protein